MKPRLPSINLSLEAKLWLHPEREGEGRGGGAEGVQEKGVEEGEEHGGYAGEGWGERGSWGKFTSEPCMGWIVADI